MSIPIRPTSEINIIINKGQHALADVGLDIVRRAKRGESGDSQYRDQIYRLVLLWTYLDNILDDDAAIQDYWLTSANEKKFNKILDGILQLAYTYRTDAIAPLGSPRNTLVFYPSAASSGAGGVSTAPPGGITFQNLSVDSPGEIINRIDATSSEYALFIIHARGNGAGEGSRADLLLVTWRGTATPKVAGFNLESVGGSTAGVSYTAAYNNGYIEITCNVPTDNWSVKGSRISFENFSLLNVPTISSLQNQSIFIGNSDNEPEGKDTVGSGDVEASTANGLIIKANAVSLGKMATLATQRILGRNTAGTGNVEALTAAQVAAMINGGRATLILEIGEWDMDANDSKVVAHGLTNTQSATIIVEGVEIYTDGYITGQTHRPLDTFDFSSQEIQGGVTLVGIDPSPGITLNRRTGGIFDNTSYDQVGGYNRGYIKLSYVV